MDQLCAGTHRVAETTKQTAEIASQNVRTSQVRSKRQNSLVGLETKLADHPEGWKHISINGNNIYALQNTPVEGIGAQSQKIVHYVLLLSSMLGIGVICLPWSSSLTQ